MIRIRLRNIKRIKKERKKKRKKERMREFVYKLMRRANI
jgi:hypothetical protein